MKEKVVYDRLTKIETLTSEATDSTIERERKRRISEEQGHHCSGVELVSGDDQVLYNIYRIDDNDCTSVRKKFVGNGIQSGQQRTFVGLTQCKTLHILDIDIFLVHFDRVVCIFAFRVVISLYRTLCMICVIIAHH